MSLLALDTSYDYCTVVAFSSSKKCHRSCKIPQKKAQSILVLIDEVLNDAGVSLSNLTGIGFTAGPGSFTGLRISVSVAQGLAYALNIPVIPFSTLQAIAQSIFNLKKIEQVRIVLDARHEQVYVGVYKLDTTSGIMQTFVPDCITKLGDEIIQQADSLYINEEALVQLTDYYYRQGLVKKASEAVPIYLQNPFD